MIGYWFWEPGNVSIGVDKHMSHMRQGPVLSLVLLLGNGTVLSLLASGNMTFNESYTVID